MLRSFLLLASVILCVEAQSAYAACTPRIDGAKRYGLREFFSRTAFGTIAFSADGSREVYVPIDGVTCLIIPRPNSKIEVIFNHRNSDQSDVGYVSFKLYGFTPHPELFSRLLRREGAWKRDTEVLPGDSWLPPLVQGRDASIINNYEAYYLGTPASDINSFDQKFGKFHGKPKGSDQFSWDYLSAMEPPGLNLSRGDISYLRHDLERVEISAGSKSTDNPPSLIWYQSQLFRTTLISVTSPLNGGVSRSMEIEFR